MIVDQVDPWDAYDPIPCPICGREACEDHLPADDLPSRKGERNPEAENAEARAVHLALVTAQEVERERARREARRLLDAEERGPILEPTGYRLREWLTTPDTATQWRIAGWQPTESRVILAAPRKSGMTTTVASLARAPRRRLVAWRGYGGACHQDDGHL